MLRILVANVLFLLIPALISLVSIFLFDIHHSFYGKNLLPLKFVFKSEEPYIIGVSAGAIIGFFLIRLFILGIKLELNRKRKG